MNRIKQLRIEQNMLQSDLARLLNASQQSVSRYETEGRGLDVETIHRLCSLFGVTADYLLGRTDMRTPEISAEEYAILAAWRQADDRTQQIVRLTLEPFANKKEKTAAS